MIHLAFFSLLDGTVYLFVELFLCHTNIATRHRNELVRTVLSSLNNYLFSIINRIEILLLVVSEFSTAYY